MECVLPFLITILCASTCTGLSFVENFVNKNIVRWLTCLETRKDALYLTGISIKQCISECALRSGCEFLGYDIRLHTCALYFDEVLNGSEERGGTCAFIFRRDMDLHEIASVCSCNEGQVCYVDNGQCLYKECQPLDFDNGIMYGNVRQVNAKVRIKCHSGYKERNGVQEITCDNNGDWSYLPSCVFQSSPATTTITHEITTTELTTTKAHETMTTESTAGSSTTTTRTTTAASTTTAAAATTSTHDITTTEPTAESSTTTTTTTATAAAVTTSKHDITTTEPTAESSTTTTTTTTTTASAAAATTYDITTTESTAGSLATTKTTTTTTASTTVNVCPSASNDWITPNATNPTFQVMFALEELKHGEASSKCSGLSSNLVKINEEWKQIGLVNLITNCQGYFSTCYWIDGSKVGSAWKFSDSNTMLSLFWDSGEPGTQSCVYMNNNQFWATKNCNNKCEGYICEM